MKYTATNQVGDGYLVTKGVPFDYRLAQEAVADLLNPANFRKSGGSDYRYEGMVVSVTDADTKTDSTYGTTPRNNGLYFLVRGSNSNERNSIANWIKLNNSTGTIDEWSQESRNLLEGELALGYRRENNVDILQEIRVGNSTATWSNTNTFIPAFLNSQKSGDGNKLFGLDSNSKPTIFAISSVATTLEKRANPSGNPGQNDGLSLSHDANTNTYTIGIENSGWEITCN